jgi:predicted TIM-barrel fold metal-dependent hydrolase
MIDGRPVPFKDLYPRFADEELSRAIQIPLNEPISAELEEILVLIADHPDVFLNSGHISPAEVMRLAELAERFGIRRMIVAHPARALLSLDQQKSLAVRGIFLEGACSDWMFHRGLPRMNYYIEREYADEIAGIANAPQFAGVVPWARQLREIGLDQIVLGTDYGIGSGPTPVEGMRLLISTLLDLDFSIDEIALLTKRNPARLLGLAE